MEESLRGQLLVASPALVDPNFARSVVFITEHSDEGAMGIVLDRPSDTAVEAVVPQLAEIAGGEPVYVGGMEVRHGDLLHADVNGVCSIPLSIAPEVAQAAAEFVDAEAVVLEFAKQGHRDVKAYSDARKETMRRIADLGNRLRARSATV